MDETDRVNVARQWKEKIEQWKMSGKSGTKWCLECSVNYKTFCYWRKKFYPTEPFSLQRSSFEELSNHSRNVKNAGIEIRIRNFSLILHKNFDLTTLKQCLKVMETSC
jgi:hypothetical protein